MKIYTICFTPGGEKTLGKILDGIGRWPQENAWRGEDAEVCAYALGSYRNQVACDEQQELDARIKTVQSRLSEWMAEAVQDADAFVFVGAAGIAIRAIAPYVADKTKDPALVVVDEKGQFVIPLLSGHIGGANELALRLATELDAQPVLTTATDVRGLFAVDVFATKNNLWISDMKLAKLVSARLVRGEKVGFYSDVPVEGTLPAELVEMRSTVGRDSSVELLERVDMGIVVSPYLKQVFAEQLSLVPRCLTVGIGCKRGTAKEKILTAVQEVFANTGLSVQAIGKVASIDLKKDEEGLIAVAQEYGVPFETFSSEALAAIEGDFSESSFVKGVTGVDNVCERAAVLASGGKLVIRKTAKDGVTVAVAMDSLKIIIE